MECLYLIGIHMFPGGKNTRFKLKERISFNVWNFTSWEYKEHKFPQLSFTFFKFSRVKTKLKFKLLDLQLCQLSI